MSLIYIGASTMSELFPSHYNTQICLAPTLLYRAAHWYNTVRASMTSDDGTHLGSVVLGPGGDELVVGGDGDAVDVLVVCHDREAGREGGGRGGGRGAGEARLGQPPHLERVVLAARHQVAVLQADRRTRPGVGRGEGQTELGEGGLDLQRTAHS